MALKSFSPCRRVTCEILRPPLQRGKSLKSSSQLHNVSERLGIWVWGVAMQRQRLVAQHGICVVAMVIETSNSFAFSSERAPDGRQKTRKHEREEEENEERCKSHIDFNAKTSSCAFTHVAFCIVCVDIFVPAKL